ncbi:hypothetical protein TSUD_335030 [Trifolium subterraneum]|uniref:Large ribosomal subunit protein uL23m n=1 Tax=Trifolium subterraneum TaxID=3900 RepID=A0A2Z6P2T4_TRISU|nr:hypothetical protein TSUD_335030 [Trifolium subterraneum]
MGSRLGRRVVNFANLPIKLLMPTTFTNIQEISLKTIPSATKIEIKRVLESLYGFEVDKVRTLNMDGKKKKRGGILIAKPDYKKAYVTLKNPLSIDPNIYPIRVIEEDKKNNLNKQAMASLVEEAPNKSHWLDEKKERYKPQNGYNRGRFDDGSGSNRDSRGRVERRPDSNRSGDGSVAKFPWTNMRRNVTR